MKLFCMHVYSCRYLFTCEVQNGMQQLYEFVKTVGYNNYYQIGC